MTHNVVWQPQPGPQELMLACPCDEVLYGGAVGGGKSDGLLGDYAEGIERYGAGWHGILFRKNKPELKEIIRRSIEIFGPVYGIKCYNSTSATWNFPTGATLTFFGVERDDDIYKFLGAQFTWVGWDELTRWASDTCYTFMFSRTRSAKGVPCRTRAATNPGGPGHTWVMDRFITNQLPGVPQKIVSPRTGRVTERVYIPAKLEDNQILMQNDPDYEDRIYQINDPVLADAMRHGRWDKIAGASFPEWDVDIHVIPSEPVYHVEQMWRSLDWGYDKPYACLWMYSNFDGDIIVCNELYGWGGKPNVGSKEAPGTVLKKIKEIEERHGWYPKFGMLDPQCDEKQGHPESIYTLLGGASMGWKFWPKGSGSRVNQKQVIHELMQVVNGKSRLKVMDRCLHLIRTLPAIPRDTHNVEDVDTDAEDHMYDALRGGLTVRVDTRQQRADWDKIMREERRMEETRSALPYGGW